VKRGEVWWYEPPDAKRRPVLILTRDEAIGRVRDVIAVPVTATIRKLDTEVEVGIADGMPIECVLTVDNTFSAKKSFLTERVTTLELDKLGEVCATLVKATSCN
jgi:mRNA interferase MazF